MRVLITGATGMIGSALVPALLRGGDGVVALTRGSSIPGATAIPWQPQSKPAIASADLASLERCDAVVHLAGANVAGHRWTRAYKQTILRSRTGSTAGLLSALRTLQHPPRLFVSASAIGIYGDRGDELLTEASPPGQGFLPEVCIAWEAATDRAIEEGMRVIHLRFGVVLAKDGGALAQMLPVFRFGLGGRLGSGDQWMSWVALSDVVRAIERAVHSEAMEGAYNVVAPHAVTNREFSRTLGLLLQRPTHLPVPALALRAAFGEMADESILASARVLPARLEEDGFYFAQGRLQTALANIL